MQPTYKLAKASQAYFAERANQICGVMERLTESAIKACACASLVSQQAYSTFGKTTLAGSVEVPAASTTELVSTENGLTS